MPPTPGKRAAAAARGTKRDAPQSDDTPGTSPVRKQTHKRKKTSDKIIEKPVEEAQLETLNAPWPVAADLPEHQEDIDMDADDLVHAVCNVLTVPSFEVQACRDLHNSITAQEKQNAYAKVAGKDWTFFVKRTSIKIGRPPEAVYPEPNDGATQLGPAESNQGISIPAATTEDSRIHIDLGPNKVVSRVHAELYYQADDFPHQPAGWFLLVNGRNGAKVDERPFRKDEIARLHSGCVIEIAGLEFMFVLSSGVEIAKPYLQRAGLIRNDFPDNADQAKHNEIHGRPTRNESGAFDRPLLQAGQQMIAPAPADYRKPDTPQSRQKPARMPSCTPRGSGYAFADVDIDLSAQENEHIKPTFTYSQLITQAILSKPDHKATLFHIYEYVKTKYAYYRSNERAEKGWQNSIRHNLSLNTGFLLVHRETHEPGKGGYWQLSEARKDELVSEAWGKTRKSPKTSSSPKMSDSKLRRPPPGPGDANGGSPVRRTKRSPRESNSPPRPFFASNIPQFTPDQHRYSSAARDELPGDGSPLPRKGRYGNAGTSMLGFSDNIQGSPPVLSSSYAVDEGNALITPAPQRKRPILAPPSTLQRPSQHMPTSSPAPFWRFADQCGTTPMRGYDASPSKLMNNPLQSSSPPRPDQNGSPSRGGAGTGGSDLKIEVSAATEVDEEPAFDLSRPFTSIAKFHSSNGVNGMNGVNGINGLTGANGPTTNGTPTHARNAV